MAATSKVIYLKGNPKNPEPAEHIIEFPGGAISLCRTTDNEYWAHISVNPEQLPGSTRESKVGEVACCRLDYNNPPGDIRSVDDLKKLIHIGVRIKVKS